MQKILNNFEIASLHFPPVSGAVAELSSLSTGYASSPKAEEKGEGGTGFSRSNPPHPSSPAREEEAIDRGVVSTYDLAAVCCKRRSGGIFPPSKSFPLCGTGALPLPRSASLRLREQGLFQRMSINRSCRGRACPCPPQIKSVGRPQGSPLQKYLIYRQPLHGRGKNGHSPLIDPLLTINSQLSTLN